MPTKSDHSVPSSRSPVSRCFLRQRPNSYSRHAHADSGPQKPPHVSHCDIMSTTSCLGCCSPAHHTEAHQPLLSTMSSGSTTSCMLCCSPAHHTEAHPPLLPTVSSGSTTSCMLCCSPAHQTEAHQPLLPTTSSGSTTSCLLCCSPAHHTEAHPPLLSTMSSGSTTSCLRGCSPAHHTEAHPPLLSTMSSGRWEGRRVSFVYPGSTQVARHFLMTCHIARCKSLIGTLPCWLRRWPWTKRSVDKQLVSDGLQAGILHQMISI
jgi:hypothetical protein